MGVYQLAGYGGQELLVGRPRSRGGRQGGHGRTGREDRARVPAIVRERRGLLVPRSGLARWQQKVLPQNGDQPRSMRQRPGIYPLPPHGPNSALAQIPAVPAALELRRAVVSEVVAAHCIGRSRVLTFKEKRKE